MNDAALLQPKLSRLRLSGILENLDARLEQAVRDKWSFSQFLHMLFDDEIARREQRQLGLRLTKSGLDPVKTLETFDFSFNARIHEPAIRQLATGD
ncbi:MAG: ATP-binding protein, partial [Planctomycetaceae bacterium]|nr:ATP-binding protein [Planctomycetaceae bacterium]